MAQGQRAGLITLRSLDRNELPVIIKGTVGSPLTPPFKYEKWVRWEQSVRPCITSHWCIKALEQHFNRHGAAEARGAHNSEDTRSKRVAGNITLQLLYRSDTFVYT